MRKIRKENGKIFYFKKKNDFPKGEKIERLKEKEKNLKENLELTIS